MRFGLRSGVLAAALALAWCGAAGAADILIDGKITIIKDCPWREGTKGAANFAKYKTGMTVKQATDLNVPPKHLNRSVQRGAIKIG